MSGRRLHWRSGRHERGVALVEFALVAPVLILLVLGIFEFGNAWRQTAGIERAVQQGARTVTSQANARYADYEALRAVDSATRSLSGVTVDQVVIYRADSADGAIPAACLTASQSGLCNRYTGAQVRTVAPTGFPPATSCAGGWDALWCPTGRDRDGINRMRIGVHLTVSYTPVTGLIPGPTMTITRTAVYQIEPCAQGQSGC